MAWSSRGCREQRRGVTDRNDVWVSRRTAGRGGGEAETKESRLFGPGTQQIKSLARLQQTGVRVCVGVCEDGSWSRQKQKQRLKLDTEETRTRPATPPWIWIRQENAI